MKKQHRRWACKPRNVAPATAMVVAMGLALGGATSAMSGCSKVEVPRQTTRGAAPSDIRRGNLETNVQVYSADNLKVTPPGAGPAFAPEDPKHMTIALHPIAGGGGEARRLKDNGDGATAKVMETRDVIGAKWFHVRIGDQQGWVAEHLVR